MKNEKKETEENDEATMVELDDQVEQPPPPEAPKKIDWFKDKSLKVFKLLSQALNPIASAVIVAIFIGLIPPLKNLFFGDRAPLKFITGVLTSLSGSSVAGIILLLGASLSPKSASLKNPSMVIGVGLIRLLLMPLIVLGMVTGLTKLGVLAG